MATVYNVVELNGNGTIRGLLFSTFNKSEAQKTLGQKTLEGRHSRKFVMLEGVVKLPSKKAEDA